ncbi:hypothetical protein TNCV_829131 [Trichonephila clavipes]|nr:hypothetical protein TNCV_829131 [Trichonephila clavipes]
MSGKDILECVQSSKSIIDTDFNGENASPVLKSSEMRSILKKVICLYLFLFFPPRNASHSRACMEKGGIGERHFESAVKGYVKSLVCADKPQTLDHLEDNIRRVIADIRPQMLEKVIENWTSRLDYIRASRGSPMSEIIFKM